MRGPTHSSSLIRKQHAWFKNNCLDTINYIAIYMRYTYSYWPSLLHCSSSFSKGKITKQNYKSQLFFKIYAILCNSLTSTMSNCSDFWTIQRKTDLRKSEGFNQQKASEITCKVMILHFRTDLLTKIVIYSHIDDCMLALSWF